MLAQFSSPALVPFFLQHKQGLKLPPAERHGQGLDECKLSKVQMRLAQDHCGQWKKRLQLYSLHKLRYLSVLVIKILLGSCWNLSCPKSPHSCSDLWWLFSLVPPWWHWYLWTAGGGWEDHSSLLGKAAVPCSCVWKAGCACLYGIYYNPTTLCL